MQVKPHHKPRHRKKLHIGEFQELGFELHADYPAGLDQAARLALCDRFIDECVEPAGINIGGGVGTKLDVFVALTGRGSATDAHRQTVTEWLTKAGFTSVNAAALKDGWYE